MLSARAVVASTAGGIPEIVQNGQSGLLVPPREVAPLVDALLRMTRDRAFRAAAAESARAFASVNLTWRGSAKRYDALYREVVERHKKAAVT